jgi:DNA segregation ATPase FtsK/SpoIIIE-like protein
MDFDGGDDDSMYKDALRVVIDSGKASTSMLQRRLARRIRPRSYV